MADDDHGFSTPRLEYLSLKKKFLSKYLDRNVWKGEFGSKELHSAISNLLQFFDQTRRMAQDFPELENDITIGNKDLVMKRILPMPPKLYEQVIAAVVGDSHQQAGHVWQLPASEILSRIEHFLSRYRSASLSYYKHRVWSDVHDLGSYISQDTACEDIAAGKNDADIAVKKKVKTVTRTQLRRQRKAIFAALSAEKCADRLLRRYRSLVEAFIHRYESELSLKEVNQLNNKLRRTEHSVRMSKSKPSKTKCNMEPKFEAPLPCVDEKAASEKEEESDTTDQIATNFDHQPFALPDVPEDDTEEAYGSVPDIERRLSQAWVHPTPTVAANVEPSQNNIDSEAVAMFSTEADREAFNQWYCTKLENRVFKDKKQVSSTSTGGLEATKAANSRLAHTEIAERGHAATEASTREHAALEGAASEHAALEAADSGHAAQEAAASGHAAQEAAASGHAVQEAAASGYAAQEAAASVHAAQEAAACGHAAQEAAASVQAAQEDAACGHAVQEAAASGHAAQEAAASGHAAQETAPHGHAAQEAAASEYAETEAAASDFFLPPPVQFQDHLSYLDTVSNRVGPSEFFPRSQPVTSASAVLDSAWSLRSESQVTLKQAQQDHTFMYIQAIIVMLFTMSRLLLCLACYCSCQHRDSSFFCPPSLLTRSGLPEPSQDV